MKIVQLTIENVMGVTAVEITPEGNTIIISGPNAAGKSSILNSMWLALAGKDAMKAIPDPIKHGEDHAKVLVELSDESDHNMDIIVTRTWTQTKTSLKIENSEGAVFKSPQAMLASLIGKLSFDPQAFANQTEKEQVQTLLSLIDLPVDLSKLDAKRKGFYDSRTVVNRDAAKLASQVDAIQFVAGVPDTEQSTADIMTEYQAASDLNVENNNKRVDLSSQIEDKNTLQAQADYIQDEIKRFENDLGICKNNLQDKEGQITELTTVVESLIDKDLESFKTRLAEVEQVNELVRRKHVKEDLYAQLQIAKSESAQLTGEIKDIDALKATTIQEANMPIEGLGLNEVGVTYDGVLLKQCATSEQHRVSIAVGMAVNPKLRIIMIPDASLLDSAYMELIEEMAIDNDFQVWMEKVDETGNLGIYIEEGAVAKDNQIHDDNQRAVKNLERQQDEIDEGIYDEDAPPSTYDNKEDEHKGEMPSMPEPATDKP